MFWYLKVLKQYADFNGRARRKEYWLFVLFNLIFTTAIVILENILGITIGRLPYGYIYLLYVIAVFVPGLTVMVRRLHDIGKNGWMILIALIPIVGPIWLLVLLAKDGSPGENKFGVNPKKSNEIKAVNEESYNFNNENIITIVVIWFFFIKFLWVVLNWLRLNEFYYSFVWVKILDPLVGIIWGLIPLCLAFIVKNKSKQILLLILGGIYLLYCIYVEIDQLLNPIEYNYFDF